MAAKIRAIVCGGRDFDDKELLWETLDAYEFSEIIEGGARGADRMAREYGEKHDILVTTVPADWEIGRYAGALRNKKMLELGPDLVIAFDGGRGTGNMRMQAKKAGVRVAFIPPREVD